MCTFNLSTTLSSPFVVVVVLLLQPLGWEHSHKQQFEQLTGLKLIEFAKLKTLLSQQEPPEILFGILICLHGESLTYRL